MILTVKSKRVLVELIRREIKRLAFDANVFDLGIETPVGRSNSKRRQELKAVLQELQRD